MSNRHLVFINDPPLPPPSDFCGLRKNLSQQGYDHKVLPVITETLDHRGGLAATAGIVTDGHGGLHLVLLNAKRPETDGRPLGVCKLLIALS